MNEEYTIKTLAEKLSVKPKNVKEVLGLAPTTAGDTVLEEDQIAKVVSEIDAIPKAEPVKKGKEPVIFYWRKGRNQEFVNGGKLYRTTKSAMKLDPVEDAGAIAWLKARKDFGRAFDELGKMNEGSTLLDELMELETPTLVALAGGTVADSHLSRGKLITKIMESKADEE